METSLKITLVIIFFIGALIIPKIADASGKNKNLTGSSYSNNEIKSDYEPPNYGGPDSQHGSGTR